MKVWENSKEDVKHSPVARIPAAILILLTSTQCFYNLIETRYMFFFS